jgi:hypothetical protein
MASEQEIAAELAHLERERQRDKAARDKAYDMHGGDDPIETEETMPEIIAQFGEWAVTPFGLECLVYPHQIQWDSLLDEVIDDLFWLEQFASHEEVNLHDFAEAIRIGRQIHHYLQSQSE